MFYIVKVLGPTFPPWGLQEWWPVAQDNADRVSPLPMVPMVTTPKAIHASDTAFVNLQLLGCMRDVWSFLCLFHRCLRDILTGKINEDHHKSVNHALCYPCQPWAEKKAADLQIYNFMWSGCTSRSRSQGELCDVAAILIPRKVGDLSFRSGKSSLFFQLPLELQYAVSLERCPFPTKFLNKEYQSTKTSTILGCLSHGFDQVNSTPCFSKHLRTLTARRNFTRASPPALRPLIWWTLWSHHPWSRGCTRPH